MIYIRIQAKRKDDGIRVRLKISPGGDRTEDFIWCYAKTTKQIIETVERFYGQPHDGRIEVVKEFAP